MDNRDDLFGKVWWKDLNGPRRFLVEAANILSGGKSVVLCLPERVPWLEIMREVLEKFLRKGTQSIKVLNAEKIFDTPQEYVLKNFCANKRGFRAYNSTTAYAKFLAESTGIELNDSCLWIRKASPAQVEQWLTFIAEYQKFLTGRKGGVFLLEAGDYWNAKSEVAILSYKKKISDYDSFAFNIFVAADFANENQLMKRYLAELVTALTEGDVEFSAACIAKSDAFLKNPEKVFEDLMWEFNSSKSTEDIEQAIWMTQLKLIFPLVETFRRNFVHRYEEQIKNFPAHHVPPEEVEIGALYTQFNTRRWLISEADANDLEFYREVRNKLAHLRVLPFDELQKIFEKNSRR